MNSNLDNEQIQSMDRWMGVVSVALKRWLSIDINGVQTSVTLRINIII